MISAVLTAEPDGEDFVVTFDCYCVLRFWHGIYSQPLWTKCKDCVQLPHYSPDLVRNKTAALKSLERWNNARRRDEAEIVTR